MLDHIFFFGFHADKASPSALLDAITLGFYALDVSAARDHNQSLFFRNQVLLGKLPDGRLYHLGFALSGEFIFGGGQFFLDDAADSRRIFQEGFEVANQRQLLDRKSTRLHSSHSQISY